MNYRVRIMIYHNRRHEYDRQHPQGSAGEPQYARGGAFPPGAVDGVGDGLVPGVVLEIGVAPVFTDTHKILPRHIAVAVEKVDESLVAGAELLHLRQHLGSKRHLLTDIAAVFDNVIDGFPWDCFHGALTLSQFVMKIIHNFP